MIDFIKKYWYVIIILLCIISLYFITNNKSTNTYELEKFEKTGEEKEKVEVSSYYVDIKGEVMNPGVYEVTASSRIIDVVELAGGLTKNADTSLLNLSKKVTDEMNIKIYSKTEVKNAKDSLVKEPEVIEIIKEIEKECVCISDDKICDDDSNKNDALIENSDFDDDNLSNTTNNNIVENNSTTIKENTSDNLDSKNTLININTATKEELMTIPNIGESKADKIIEYRNKNKFTKIEDILNVSGIGDSIFAKIKSYITV